MAREITIIGSDEAIAFRDYIRPVCAERAGWWLAINQDVPRSRGDEILEEVARASD